MKFELKVSARAAVLGLAAASVLATAATAGPIEDRQQAMKNVGKAMGQLAAIAKKEAAFDAAVVKAAGESIAENAKVFKVNFPEDSKDGPPETWAKAEIWANMDDFNMKADKSVEAAMAMAAVTDEANFGAAMGALGGSCKACHEDYRRPKE
ncbi:MAG: cytochrome c [Anderseniella sp.]|jgi:cytochrome c556|nr:cytochrome c [Anderseniella sp.]